MERFQAPEALFNPELLGREDEGVQNMLFGVINKADMDVRKDFYGHIVLSGGTTMFPGFPTRLEKEMTKLYLRDVLRGDKNRLATFKLNIEDPPTRKHLVFVGGAVLADIMKDKSDYWITRQEYQELGPDRCFKAKP